MSEPDAAALPARESVWSDGENTADQVRGLLALLRDVAASGHAEIDPRLSYVDVQIDVDTWRRISGMFPQSKASEVQEAAQAKQEGGTS